MCLQSRKNLAKVIPAGFFFLCLFMPAMSLAGSSPVVTVGDSSSGGAVNFAPPTIAGGGEASDIANDVAVGGSPAFEIYPGVTVTVSSVETAANNGSLGQDQITNGFGAGGAAVTLSDQSSENVKNAAAASAVLVDGQSMTPLDALLSLSTSPDLGNLRVTMPNGVNIDLSSIVSNVTAALTTENQTLIGTALNDAAIALSQALRNGENASDLRSVGEVIASLLDAARST